MTHEEHKARHVELHRALDDLMTDFFIHTGKLFSKASIAELAAWAAVQAEDPTPTPESASAAFIKERHG